MWEQLTHGLSSKQSSPRLICFSHKSLPRPPQTPRYSSAQPRDETPSSPFGNEMPSLPAKHSREQMLQSTKQTEIQTFLSLSAKRQKTFLGKCDLGRGCWRVGLCSHHPLGHGARRPTLGDRVWPENRREGIPCTRPRASSSLVQRDGGAPPRNPSCVGNAW